MVKIGTNLSIKFKLLNYVMQCVFEKEGLLDNSEIMWNQM